MLEVKNKMSVVFGLPEIMLLSCPPIFLSLAYLSLLFSIFTEDVGNKILRNVATYLANHTASHPEIQ